VVTITLVKLQQYLLLMPAGCLPLSRVRGQTNPDDSIPKPTLMIFANQKGPRPQGSFKK
jgi:hypothetical protein